MLMLIMRPLYGEKIARFFKVLTSLFRAMGQLFYRQTGSYCRSIFTVALWANHYEKCTGLLMFIVCATMSKKITWSVTPERCQHSNVQCSLLLYSGVQGLVFMRKRCVM